MSFIEEFALALATYKIMRFVDSTTELKEEQLKYVQMQNEIERLKLELTEQKKIDTIEMTPKTNTQDEICRIW